MTGEAEAPLACWLCERPIDTLIEWHHLVPRSRKGRVKVPVHPICHETIHANFTNSELARFGADRGRLLENEPLAKFIAWISDKPPDFHAPTR